MLAHLNSGVSKFWNWSVAVDPVKVKIAILLLLLLLLQRMSNKRWWIIIAMASLMT